MSERMKFISRYLEGERITDLSREFGISRQTGHTLVKRYERFGPEALRNRSSKPVTSPHRTPKPKVEQIVKLRGKHPTWGPKKLKARLEALHPEVRWPAPSTIGVVLADAGLIKGRKRRRKVYRHRAPLRQTAAPNQLWCMDYKGQFPLGNKSWCYPLTVTDHFSRYITGCEALESTCTQDAQTTLWDIFDRYGMPEAIRSDNGTPFASRGKLGLSTLAIQLLRLGIQLERIEPGHPEQNGRHERMHRTLKAEATRPAGHNIFEQQAKLDEFRNTFNNERPHEALRMKTPASVFRKSERKLLAKLPPLSYPLHDSVHTVSKCGKVRALDQNLFIGTAFSGQDIGLRQAEEHTYLISFMDFDLGYFDLETKQFIDINENSSLNM